MHSFATPGKFSPTVKVRRE